MNATATVTEHYSTGGLLERLLEGLRASGKDLDTLTPEDLYPGDQFHTGGAAATAAFIAQLNLGPHMRVLDIGCGAGGVSRAIAHATGARVTGVDLTPDFIETARGLSSAVGLEGLTHFRTGSATELPLNDRFFDAAVMVHVGMNIADKAAVLSEAFRILRPGGKFAIFDVMEGPEPGPLDLPMPWASEAGNSHVVAPDDYLGLAVEAGFVLERQHNLRAAVIEKLDAHPLPRDLPPFGPHIVMGETFRDKVANYNAAIRAGRVAPVEMFFTRPI